eukprot:2483988-Rhodomonas_salina.1
MCPFNTYASVSWGMCVRCPVGATSVSGSFTLLSCSCGAGFGFACMPFARGHDTDVGYPFGTRVVLNASFLIDATAEGFHAERPKYIAALVDYLALREGMVEVLRVQSNSTAPGVRVEVTIELPETISGSVEQALAMDASLLALMEHKELASVHLLQVLPLDGCAPNSFLSIQWRMCVRCPPGSTSLALSAQVSDCECSAQDGASEPKYGVDCFPQLSPAESEDAAEDLPLSLNVTMVVQANSTEFRAEQSSFILAIGLYLNVNVSDIYVIQVDDLPSSTSGGRRRLAQQDAAAANYVKVLMRIDILSSWLDSLSTALQDQWSLLSFLESREVFAAVLVGLNKFCPPGTIVVRGGDACGDCDANFYASEPWAACVPCPFGSWAPEKTSSLEECTCALGKRGMECFTRIRFPDEWEAAVTLNVTVLAVVPPEEFQHLLAGPMSGFITDFLDTNVSSWHHSHISTSTEQVSSGLIVVPEVIAEAASKAVMSWSAYAETQFLDPSFVVGVQGLCPPGTFLLDWQCRPCPPGTHRSAPALSDEACAACPPGLVTMQPGALTCAPCANGTVPDAEQKACISALNVSCAASELKLDPQCQ